MYYQCTTAGIFIQNSQAVTSPTHTVSIRTKQNK